VVNNEFLLKADGDALDSFRLLRLQADIKHDNMSINVRCIVISLGEINQQIVQRLILVITITIEKLTKV